MQLLTWYWSQMVVTQSLFPKKQILSFVVTHEKNIWPAGLGSFYFFIFFSLQPVVFALTLLCTILRKLLSQPSDLCTREPKKTKWLAIGDNICYKNSNLTDMYKTQVQSSLALIVVISELNITEKLCIGITLNKQDLKLSNIKWLE